MARQWQSPPGNLYTSTLIRCGAADPPAPSLALLAGVALHEALRVFAPDLPLRLKWPNDLLIDGRKCAGVLLERIDDAVVIGFGVNLKYHPEDIDKLATSLAHSDVIPPEPSALVEVLAEALARWIGIWRGQGLGPVISNWMASAHPVGTALSANLGDGQRVDGLFQGLDPSGALMLRLADGTVRVIHAGDVFLI